ncbi:hypothetical protein D918_10020 [Trichuris suis]|nr:hypothetical protein D918_10020 [Trichuris suis]
MEKCHFFKQEVKYLGHIVSAGGVRADPVKTEVVDNWPCPTSTKELRQFLGLASYYRRFVPSFASIAAPLHKLMRKWSRWNWTTECEASSRALKAHLTSAPTLSFPDFSRPFILDTDASSTGLGAVLAQEVVGKERVIAYASRSMTKAERKYSTTRQEMLALVWAVQHFRPYLYGKKFVVRTDHNSLRWLRSFKEPEGQIARWLELLSNYDFEVEHRPGREMKKETLNTCWKKLWPDRVHDYEGFSPDEVQHAAVSEAVTLAKLLGAKGFDEISEEQVPSLMPILNL